MLVEFKRYEADARYPRAVEDEEIESSARAERKLSVNPLGVHAVVEMTDGISTVLRLSDGRGFRVAGNYQEVVEKLSAAGNEAVRSGIAVSH